MFDGTGGVFARELIGENLLINLDIIRGFTPAFTPTVGGVVTWFWSRLSASNAIFVSQCQISCMVPEEVRGVNERGYERER